MSVVEDIRGPSTYSVVAQLFELVEIRLLIPLLLQMLITIHDIILLVQAIDSLMAILVPK